MFFQRDLWSCIIFSRIHTSFTTGRLPIQWAVGWISMMIRLCLKIWIGLSSCSLINWSFEGIPWYTTFSDTHTSFFLDVGPVVLTTKQPQSSKILGALPLKPQCWSRCCSSVHLILWKLRWNSKTGIWKMIVLLDTLLFRDLDTLDHVVPRSN